MLAAELRRAPAAGAPPPAATELLVEIGACTRAADNADEDRYAVVHTFIGAEPFVIALVADGFAGEAASEWCCDSLISRFVAAAAGDASAPSLHRAAATAFLHAHDTLDGEAGAMVTLVAVNRARREVTSANAGCVLAVIDERAELAESCDADRASPLQWLTADHRITSDPSEQRRLEELGALVHARPSAPTGGDLAPMCAQRDGCCADDARAPPAPSPGPLLVWPAAIASARALGGRLSDASPRALCPDPFCSTVSLPSASRADVLIGSEGVWRALTACGACGLARASPSVGVSARAVVNGAISRLSNAGEALADTTCVLLRIHGIAERPSYSAIRAANGHADARTREGRPTVRASPRVRPRGLPADASADFEPSSPGSTMPTASLDSSREEDKWSQMMAELNEILPDG